MKTHLPFIKLNRLPIFNLIFVTALVFTLFSCNKSETFTQRELTGASEDESISRAKRNIVIILADDIGYDAIASNGNQSFQTPNIDQMAAEGMKFTHVYSSPLCSPSRTAFISGKYNFRNYFSWGSFDPNSKSFANIAKDAGYATFVAGKWGFDGGDATAHRIGFDSYCLYNPFDDIGGGKRYKDPKLYKDGAFIPNSMTKGLYGDDINTAEVLSFINENRNNPFFVFFPITLCHYPYSPTPDDPEFAAWNNKSESDVKYFPSMVKYMDKKVGQIRDSLKSWNLYHNTIFMFVGDNGTAEHIFYWYNGNYIEGAKGESSDGGTHVPLIVTWPKKIQPESINHNLIEFQDFLPTVAEAVRTEIDESYGIIDGLSFYKQLTGKPTEVRSYVFNHYVPYTENGNNRLKRWINDTTYKLYDQTGKFYNIALDPEEENPIKMNERTPEEKDIVQNFQNIMNSLK